MKRGLLVFLSIDSFQRHYLTTKSMVRFIGRKTEQALARDGEKSAIWQQIIHLIYYTKNKIINREQKFINSSFIIYRLFQKC